MHRLGLFMYVFYTCMRTHPASASYTSVNIRGLGKIVGNVKPGCNEYLGIKFADAQRFEDPRPVDWWPKHYDATRRGPMCFQQCPSVPYSVCEKEGMSEDCLFLNIFTPRYRRNRCVMIFIHGGNFRSFSGGSPVHNGESFAKTGGCVLVTINYRLAAFGFLGTRNLGIKDQIMAIQWVNKYIHHFGGSNRKITVFGQGTGAVSIAILLSIPEVSRNIRRVILQSCPFTLPFMTAAQGAAQELHLARLMGCTSGDLWCYKQADPRNILIWQDQVIPPTESFLSTFTFWGPVIDGQFVKNHALELFTTHQTKSVHTVIGTVFNEGDTYIYRLFPKPIDQRTLMSVLSHISRKLTLDVLRQFYDVDSYHDKRVVLSEIITDYVFRCSSSAVSRIIASSSTAYSYLFNQTLPLRIWGPGHACNDLVCHGIDVPTVFGFFPHSWYTLPQDQRQLSTDVIRYWNNFANTGSPNGWSTDLPDWWANGQCKEMSSPRESWSPVERTRHVVYPDWYYESPTFKYPTPICKDPSMSADWFMLLQASNTRLVASTDVDPVCQLFERNVGYNPYPIV